MKKLNLNSKFVLIFLLTLTAMFVLMFAVVQIVAQVSSNSYIQSDVLTTHRTLNSEVTDVLNEINYGYTRMVESDLITDLTDGESDSQSVFEQIVADSALSADYVNIVLHLNGSYLCTNSDFDLPSKSFGKKITEGNAILYLGEVNSEQNYVQIGRKFQSASANISGYVVFYVKADVFNGFCSVTDVQTGYTQLVTENYKIIAKSDGQNIGQTLAEQDTFLLKDNVFKQRVNGRRYLVAITQLNNQYSLNWYFVSVLDSNVLQKDFITLSWVLAIIAVVSGIFAVIVSVRVSHGTIAPVNNLSQKISSVDFQNRHGLQIGSEGDELYELERNYDQMLQRLFRLMDENKQNMETQRKLEMDALQMQINPHFLYNTLDAIAWMAKIKKQSEIEKLVINLAKFFRISLHKGDKYVTLKEETELIEHFLEIEKIRFPDTINYVCDLPDGIGEYKMLKLVLQPIVENSIKHGFSGRSGVGTIKISARAEDEDILISVSDDGCGFDVSENFWTEKTDKPNGFGLYNVNERIRLEYGDGYGLSITSQKGVGTTVDVRIKKRL